MKFTSVPLSVGNFFLKRTRNKVDEFSTLFHRYEALVRKVIFQITGDSHLNDLTQEAFIRIWKNHSSFKNESEISTWIYRISVNVALDSLRQRKRLSEVSDYDFAAVVDEKRSQEQQATDQQLVQKGLNALNEEHRVVLILALIHELPLKEIAHMLEISEGTVKSRLHYGKEHFRQFIAELSEKRGLYE